jgi:hypothetical protein
MNVLLLTPDGVGGTLLERTLTVYMTLQNLGKPVINIPHPEGGIEAVYSPEFNQVVLTKKNVKFDFYQSLEDIVGLYQSVDHFTVSKLTHYTMLRRQDPVNQTVPFYKHFDDTCFVIACRRDNLFEHALSWGISKISKAKNVYDHQTKVNTFIDLYSNGIVLDQTSIVQTLENYKDYLTWADEHFSVASYYYYERHMPNIEEYVHSLPIFNNQAPPSFKDIFGISFSDWNKAHFFASDVGSIALDNPNTFPQIADAIKNTAPLENADALEWVMPREFLQAYQDVAAESWPNIRSIQEFNQLPEFIIHECRDFHQINNHLDQSDYHRNVAANFSEGRLEFLNTHATNYIKVVETMERMSELGILPTAVFPIKKQTLAEKKLIIKNFDECVETYNSWIKQNPTIGALVDSNGVNAAIDTETKIWSHACNSVDLLSDTNK